MNQVVTRIVSADYVQLPLKKPGLFPGRPWTVYYEGGTRDDGKRVKSGMCSFVLKRDAVRFVFSVCPAMNSKDLPF